MIYKNDITVDIHDVDYNGVARFSSLMRYIQSAAQNQLTENGMSYDELYNKYHRAFLLSRIRIEFTESIRAYDRITACTYPCESRAYSFLRCYSVEKEGRTVGRAVSIWALIDTDTHSLVKVNSFDLGLELHEPHSLTLSRFILPSELEDIGSYTVSYADIDQNRHMNNTKYPDMYSNFLPLDGMRIKSISINYIKEAPLGEVLRVLGARGADGRYYIRTLLENGDVNTEAEIELTEI